MILPRHREAEYGSGPIAESQRAEDRARLNRLVARCMEDQGFTRK